MKITKITQKTGIGILGLTSFIVVLFGMTASALASSTGYCTTVHPVEEYEKNNRSPFHAKGESVKQYGDPNATHSSPKIAISIQILHGCSPKNAFATHEDDNSIRYLEGGDANGDLKNYRPDN